MTRLVPKHPAGWRISLLILSAVFVLLLGLVRPAAAASPSEELVEESRFSVERMLADENFADLKNYMERARGVLIIPELVKASFIVGAEGGSGVLLVRGGDGTWSAPVFYTLAAASFGLQAGGQVSEVVFTLMTDGAVEAMLDNEFKLGVDVSVAVGPFGKGLEASTTTNLSDDVYAFSKAVGLFGGGALEGAKIFSRQEWNDEYYGAAASPRAVVIERAFFNSHADKLRNALP